MKFFSFKDTEGPGIGTDAERAPAYIRFFKTYFLNFSKMVGLNLVYVFACLPILTIGPATAALNYVMRNFSQDKHVDVLYDFTRKCKEYFKPGLLLTLFDIVVGVLLYFSISLWMDVNLMASIPEVVRIVALVVLLFIAYLVICANFYMFTMLVSFELTLGQVIRNSFILAMHKIGRNIAMLLVNGILFIIFLLFWQIAFPVYLACVFTFCALFNNFMIYPVLLKHIALDNPQKKEKSSVEESIFHDTH